MSSSKGTLTPFELNLKKQENFAKTQGLFKLQAKTNNFGKYQKTQTTWPRMASKQNEKGCKVRGGGGLLHLSKTPSSLKLPISTPT